MKSLHFISGLPRSGTTLLASLLQQDKHIHASISSPLAHIYDACQRAMGTQNEAVDFIGAGQREAILRGIFEKYYSFYRYFPNALVPINVEDEQICFDNSRAWTARHHELFELFPDSKMIVMVRPVNEILNSFERVYQNNKLMASRMYDPGSNCTQRCNKLFSESGVVLTAFNNIKDAFFFGDPTRILFVRYHSLIDRTHLTMEQIYDFIGEKFDIEQYVPLQIPSAAEFDKRLGVEGLHTIKENVEKHDYGYLIPPEIWNAHNASAFWNSEELNTKGIKVL